MDASVITKLHELISSGALDATDVPAVVIPSGCKIESLEHLLAAPVRRRVKFRTSDIGDFCSYVKEQAIEGQTGIYINPNGLRCVAIIDDGDSEAPQWREHSATFATQPTPEYQALTEICSGPVTQRQLIDWLEDWGEQLDVVPSAEGEPMAVAKAINAVRKVDIKALRAAGFEEGDLRATRTSMETIEASSASGRLPDRFRTVCTIYPCAIPRELMVRLSMFTGADVPRFQLRIIGLEQELQDVAEEIQESIRESLVDTGCRIYIGES